ncbi:MAG TPA: sulfite oxidase-like oxidoreductase [Chloroflexota bacterium]|jgi:DMSO/TMAO reductase YedYZ molybdopterin-dependent catalytic subunit
MDFFTKAGREEQPHDRLPPGQYLTKGWPVLHYGDVPRPRLADWTFRVSGLVEQPQEWTYEALLALGRTRVERDVHCVTRWSKFDNVFEGIPFRAVLAAVQPKPEAKYVMVQAEQGFTANVPLDDLDRDTVLFAHTHNGKDLELDHGWPLRLVVPHLYFWKSAKWVRGLEFRAEDAPGFWESYGYHMRGDPWQEQRYWGD